MKTKGKFNYNFLNNSPYSPSKNSEFFLNFMLFDESKEEIQEKNLGEIHKKFNLGKGEKKLAQKI